jgi:hypothetical protein
MASIKMYLPALSKILEMSPATIYERHRALVRLGALEPLPGRGRGSGVELNSRNLATLLIGCAAFLSLSDLDERVYQYIRAASTDEKACRITGCKTLREAIQSILERKFTDDHPHVLAVICFYLKSPAADILWAGKLVVPGMPPISRFGSPQARVAQPIDFRSFVADSTVLDLRSLLNTAGYVEDEQ